MALFLATVRQQTFLATVRQETLNILVDLLFAKFVGQQTRRAASG